MPSLSVATSVIEILELGSMQSSAPGLLTVFPNKYGYEFLQCSSLVPIRKFPGLMYFESLMSCGSGVDMSFVIPVAPSGNTRNSNVNASSGMKGILFEPLWTPMMSLMTTTTCMTS